MYWLMKSEPETFSVDDLAKKKHEPWNGVRNYQARNFMREMQVGDEAFFYHSNCKVPGIVGRMQIAKLAYPDPTQFETGSEYFDPKSTKQQPRWWMVDVAFVEKFKNIISLNDLKEMTAIQHLKFLQKGNRLSIVPIDEKSWRLILQRVD
jgi:predicted RNA-binding protein with PUA-like domain